MTDDDVAGLAFSTQKLSLEFKADGHVLQGEAYMIKLTSQPTHAVHVGLSVLDASTNTRSKNTYLSIDRAVFNAANWNIEQRIYAVANSTDIKTRSEFIYHAIESLDPMYGSSTSGVAAANAARGPRLGVVAFATSEALAPPRISGAVFSVCVH